MLRVDSLAQEPRRGTDRGCHELFRRSFMEWDRTGVPIRQADVPLQRAHTRSPDQALSNVARHLRHWRRLATSAEGGSLGARLECESVIKIHSRRHTPRRHRRRRRDCAAPHLSECSCPNRSCKNPDSLIVRIRAVRGNFLCLPIFRQRKEHFFPSRRKGGSHSQSFPE